MVTRAPRRFRWTRADLDRLPDDGNRYEVLDGELLVTPQASFRHQGIAFEIAVRLRGYCDRHQIANVVGPGAIPFGKSELQPDVQVIPGRHKLLKRTKWAQLPRPILVVEVLSDSTAWRDLGKKREAYLRIGVAEYWAVDPDDCVVHVWKGDASDATVVRDVLSWQPRLEVAPLEISLDTLLSE
jgi:Uma2 family endonuclease